MIPTLVGELFCTLGVSMVFHTYIPPEAYELFVSELSKKLQKPTARLKWVYDVTSCIVAISLSFLFAFLAASSTMFFRMARL